MNDSAVDCDAIFEPGGVYSGVGALDVDLHGLDTDAELVEAVADPAPVMVRNGGDAGQQGRRSMTPVSGGPVDVVVNDASVSVSVWTRDRSCKWPGPGGRWLDAAETSLATATQSCWLPASVPLWT